MIPIILHLDMNSYFASAEQQDNPSWRGKPVGVCEHLGGIIIAASVEAKRWGITTGTPVWEARKLYPKIILTRTHPDRYRLYSNRFMKILQDYTAHLEQYSIDEAFLDLTQVCNIKLQMKDSWPQGVSSSLNPKSEILNPEMANPFLEAANIAKVIKMRMKIEVGDWLTCSVGIGENKLIAKIASDLKKPDGLVIIQNSKFKIQNFGTDGRNKNGGILMLNFEDLYHRLKLTDIPGIGRRQEKRLNELGIKRLTDLRDYPKSRLEAVFGIMGHHLYAMGQLKSTWKPKVEQDEEIKSIGHMYTLPKEYREKQYFVPVLYKLSEMVATRMRAQEMVGNRLHFYLAGEWHEGYGKSKRLGYYLQDGREIFLECMRIFQHLDVLPQMFKLIGVTISGLKEENGQQSLFKKDEDRRKVSFALDKINEKYGDFTVCRVPVRLAGNVFKDSIGFGRIKENVRLASFR